MIPLCGINIEGTWGEDIQLPKYFSNVAGSLLRKESIDVENSHEFQSLLKVNNSLLSETKISFQWAEMVRRLKPYATLDFFSRLVTLSPIKKEHWDNLFKKVDFNLETSFHYQLGVLGVSFLISGLSIVQMGFLIFLFGDDSWISGLLGSMILISILFWVAVFQGAETSLNSSLFLRLGPLGLFAFFSELQKLFRQKNAGTEIKLLIDRLSGPKFVRKFVAVAFAVSVACVLIGIFLVASHVDRFVAGSLLIAFVLTGFTSIVLAIAVAVAGPISIAFTIAVSAVVGLLGWVGSSTSAEPGSGAFLALLVFPISVAIAFALAGSGVGAVIAALVIAFIVAVVFSLVVASVVDGFFIALPTAFAVAVVLGFGLGFWFRVAKHSERKWLYFLSLLAFPWFCWAPLTLTFGTLGGHTLLDRFSPLKTYLWPQALVLVGTLVFTASGLGWWGYLQDKAARNPLHGGHLERVLSSLRR